MSSLSQYLEARSINQRQFAAMVGVDPSIISRLVADKMRPSLELAAAIQEATSGEVPAVGWVLESARSRTNVHHAQQDDDASDAVQAPVIGEAS